MRKHIAHHYKRRRNFILYGIIGVSGASLDFVIFLILFNAFGIPALVANFISTNCGIINNFFLNAHFNFKKTDRLWSRFFSFYLTGVLGIVVSSAIIKICHDDLGFNANFVKAGSIVVVVILQYALNKTFSFKTYEQQNTKEI